MISYFQAIVIGLLQGVTELFPVSSLGHSVLLPALLGWSGILKDQAAQESPFLAFLVGLHVATALALLWFFREDWARIVAGLLRSLRTRQIETADERLGWLLVVATIPAGLVGVIFEHELRTLFAKPLAAAIFLTINGGILLAGERLRRASGIGDLERRLDPRRLEAIARGERQHERLVDAEDGMALLQPPRSIPATPRRARALSTLSFPEATLIGAAQILAFFAGISRSGVTMVTGLSRGLDHEDAARFAFLLATPIILAAGVYKLPDFLGPNGNGVRGQILVGSLVAAGAAYVSVRFLIRWFETRTLTPFAIYCLVAGILCIIRFS